jgi:hypothetical protein
VTSELAQKHQELDRFIRSCTNISLDKRAASVKEAAEIIAPGDDLSLEYSDVFAGRFGQDELEQDRQHKILESKSRPEESAPDLDAQEQPESQQQAEAADEGGIIKLDSAISERLEA